MDIAVNVLVLEFGWAVGWLTVSTIAVVWVAILVDGVWGVPGCTQRRAAQRKAEHVRVMRGVLHEFGRGYDDWRK
jgi:hypothetical protein